MPDDVELVEAALSGSQDAYRQLLERYQRPVYVLVRRMVGSAPAEDLAQEVFLKAFRALHTFDRRRKFSSWLFKIAHNTAIDLLRRRELDTVALDPVGADEPGLVAVLPDLEAESPAARVERQDLARALGDAVVRLRPEYREVIVLRYQAGLSYEEIAEVTDLPLGTVKTHLFRARKAMARDLLARGWRPDSG